MFGAGSWDCEPSRRPTSHILPVQARLTRIAFALGLGRIMATEVMPKDVAQDPGPFDGLALMWDNTPDIRHRLRGGGNLLVHYDTKLKKECNFAVEKTTANVKANKYVLKPVCKLIRENGKCPDIEVLERQVRQVFSLYTVNTVSKVVQDQAWAIRHLIAVLKGTVRPPKTGASSQYGRCPKDPKNCTCLLPMNLARFIDKSI